jgi:hypothetical protein
MTKFNSKRCIKNMLALVAGIALITFINWMFIGALIGGW